MKKWLVRILISIAVLAVALLLLVAITFRLVNRTNGTLISSGERRAYLLYVPESYNSQSPTPLVISIHGYAEWPGHQAQISRWNDLAEEYGFIVVYPSGTGFPLRWRTYGDPGSATDPAPDIAFFTDLIDLLEQKYNIDPNRIYANGLSNGGGMSFVLACQLSQRIAAVGMVSGAYLYPWESCNPARPVPAVVFHGTSDEIVPYEGGSSTAFHLPFPAIPEWVDILAERNGCSGAPAVLTSSGEVNGIQYIGCAADVVFYTVTGGGHAWPGGEPLPEWIAGRTTQDIDATRVMWDFFQQHPLEGIR